jgi:hypothetical protein
MPPYKNRKNLKEYDNIAKIHRIHGFAARQMGSKKDDANEQNAICHLYWTEGWEMADRFLENRI